jgi:hypothetical protein
VGVGAEPATYLLAAHDAEVTFVAADVGCVERVESRMAAEALAGLFDGYVAPVGPCLPCFLESLEQVDVVVLDPNTLASCKSPVRAALIADLQRRSRPGGVHVVLGGSRALSADAIRALYEGWSLEEEPLRPTGCCSPSRGVPPTLRPRRWPRLSDTCAPLDRAHQDSA